MKKRLIQEESLYIHIPFCRHKCGYCDFYSVLYKDKVAFSYTKALCAQIAKIGKDFSAIYIGGGTPSVLDARDLKKLLSALKGVISRGAEVTIEANPESVSLDKLRLFIDGGINRISVGVQSFEDRNLRRLGRIHTAKEAREAIRLCRKAGFDNISIDLIFGVWEETFDAWRSELNVASSLPVKHISCYALTYEESTPIFTARRKGIIMPLKDEAVGDMYLYALDLLPRLGFRHYEVSNFAKKGFECRHNLNYWDNGSYIGLGASAVSYVGGVRRRNVSDVKEYVRRIEKEEGVAASSEHLSGLERAKETAAVKIRTKAGIDFKWFKEKTGFDFEKIEKEAITFLLSRRLIRYGRGRSGIYLTKKGFLFCDTASSELV